MQNLMAFVFMIMCIHFGVFSQDCNLQVKHEISHGYCEGKNDAKLTLSVTGGFPPYNYLWDNGSRSNTIKLSSQGFYHVKITDRKGCVTEFSNEYQPVSALRIDNITGESQSNGTERLQANARGGIPPYNYYWIGPGNKNTNAKTLSDALPGNYLLVVKDSKNCVLSQSYEVKEK